MATNKLKVFQVNGAQKPGYLADGGGLLLQVTKAADGTIRRSWVVRFRIGGQLREMGLGTVDAVSLSDARELAQAARKLAAKGVDPIEARRAARNPAPPKSIPLTFKQAAESYIEAHEGGWKNKKHRQQWPNSLATYAYSLRLSLAARLLLPEATKAGFRKLDEIRNRLGHRLNYRLSYSEVDALAEAVDKLMSSDGARSCTQRYLEVRGDDGAVTLPKIGYPDADERTRLVIVLMSFFSELIKLSAKTS